MNDYTPYGKTMIAMDFDTLHNVAVKIVAEHEDGGRYYVRDGSGWKRISRFSYELLVEIGVNVELAREESR